MQAFGLATCSSSLWQHVATPACVSGQPPPTGYRRETSRFSPRQRLSRLPRDLEGCSGAQYRKRITQRGRAIPAGPQVANVADRPDPLEGRAPRQASPSAGAGPAVPAPVVAGEVDLVDHRPDPSEQAVVARTDPDTQHPRAASASSAGSQRLGQQPPLVDQLRIPVPGSGQSPTADIFTLVQQRLIGLTVWPVQLGQLLKSSGRRTPRLPTRIVALDYRTCSCIFQDFHLEDCVLEAMKPAEASDARRRTASPSSKSARGDRGVVVRSIR